MKETAGEVGKKAGKLSGLLEKTKKSFKIKARTKGIVKKFLPKKRCRKIEVVDIENLAKKQELRPNIQLFAKDVGDPIYRIIHGEKRNIRLNLGHHKKHFFDVNNKNYIEGKSILYISAEEAQELLDKFAGKGQMKGPCKEVLNFGKVIGEYIEEETEKNLEQHVEQFIMGKNERI